MARKRKRDGYGIIFLSKKLAHMTLSCSLNMNKTSRTLQNGWNNNMRTLKSHCRGRLVSRATMAFPFLFFSCPLKDNDVSTLYLNSESRHRCQQSI